MMITNSATGFCGSWREWASALVMGRIVAARRKLGPKPTPKRDAIAAELERQRAILAHTADVVGDGRRAIRQQLALQQRIMRGVA